MKWLLACVAMFVVFPLRGMQKGDGFNPGKAGGALPLNGVRGLAVVKPMQLCRPA